MKTIAHQFADTTAKLEDLHAIAVEGQRADNTRDMQCVLVNQLCSGVKTLNGSLQEMAAALGMSQG